MKLNKSTKKIIIFVLIIAVVVIANHFLGLSSYLKMEKLMELKTVVDDNFLLQEAFFLLFPGSALRLPQAYSLERFGGHCFVPWQRALAQ